MKIVNHISGEIVSGDAKVVASFFGRLRGLILHKKGRDIVLVAPKEGIATASIHMLGVLHPLDVIWLDSKKRVVDFKKEVNPFNPLKPKTWRIYKPKTPAKYVVELGLSKIKNLEVGNTVDFE